jgi:hypothetical protein
MATSMGAFRRIPARDNLREGHFLALPEATTRQKILLQNACFLALGGIFCGRIKSKGLVHPALSLFALYHQE